MPLRLGILVPSSNTALEPLTSAMVAGLPAALGVSVHYARFPVTEIALSGPALAQFAAAPLLAAARLLADARVDAVGWSGTSGGWLGFAADEALCRAITEAAGGVPATTSTLALNRALERLGARQNGKEEEEDAAGFALVTPYLEDVQAAVVATYRDAGFAVLAESHLGRRVNVEFAEVGEAELDRQVREVVQTAKGKGKGGGGGLRAVSTFCTNLRAAQRVPYWEELHGVPVLDTVATVLWDLLRIKGVPSGSVKGWGRLFEL
ncbi:Asp/Glu/hydantoin racemase [Xylariomycetidae sp. FL0641]|nr:Asp/Glu/hydantoin racemase [Xylariomycetidae sp. FL0641]